MFRKIAFPIAIKLMCASSFLLRKTLAITWLPQSVAVAAAVGAVADAVAAAGESFF
jgi:hypothetical protein